MGGVERMGAEGWARSRGKRGEGDGLGGVRGEEARVLLDGAAANDNALGRGPQGQDPQEGLVDPLSHRTSINGLGSARPIRGSPRSEGCAGA